MSKEKKSSVVFDAIIASPVGPLGLKLREGHLSFVCFLPDAELKTPPQLQKLEAVKQELGAYFKNPQHCFDLDLLVEGTPFQKAVWAALLRIPQGETRSYQALAKQLKTSPRAVGNACRANPLALIVPCHRVLAKSGLGGFCGKKAGKYLKIKTWLLAHEGALLALKSAPE